MPEDISLNILIVDDNPNNIFSLRNLLEDNIENITIFEAVSGMVALNTLVKIPIDLIVLDVQMPEMDGFETAQLIRSRKKNRQTPIIFLSAAYKSEQFQKQGYALGATDYLTKPIDSIQLLSHMRLYIRFILQEREYNRDLENRILERTQALREANKKMREEAFEREKAQQAVEWAKNNAEAANMAKTQFLANMSHELRTPLNAILGYSEILKEELSEEGQIEHCEDLGHIYQAGQHLLTLISDILEISKIETGQIEVNVETFFLKDFLEKIIKTIKPFADKNNNTLEINHYEPSIQLHSDPAKLRHILQNILCNASKFTHDGIIKWTISCVQVDDSEWLFFSIEDTGIGIEPQQQAIIFDAFNQVDNSTTRKYGGTGLGLAISKQFAHLLGGDLDVSSQPGEGSKFTLKLPMQSPFNHQEKAS